MYKIVRPLNKLIFKTLFRLKVEGRKNIPKTGHFVVVANHESLLDGFVLAAAIERQITFMAAAFLFKKPFVGWFLKQIGAIPVKKEGQNLAGLKRALGVLERGGVIGIFPEGGIFETDLYFGAAYLAARSGVALLPASIIGADKVLPVGQRWPRFVQIRVIIGDGIAVERSLKPSRKLLEETTEILRSNMDILRTEGDVKDGRG
ncbi:MAG: lysophospholipid acyltransferase family protein [Actinomycetota bacterium]|nr:lysophospholipid acyltransferase family protein [Actinomycetota bacterium]